MTFFDQRGRQVHCQQWLKTYEPYYFLSGPKYGRKINARNQTSRFVEDEVCSLLNKASTLSADDLARIMAWKLGLIDHRRSESTQRISYKQDWPATLAARLQFQTLDFSASIPTLAANMATILVQLQQNNPQYLFNLVPQLRGFGNIYILTILFFISNGRFPIYDKYAHVAATAIREGLRPGSKVSYKGIQKWRDYEEFMSLLALISEACPQETDISQMLIARPLDRALWVYGHFFVAESGRAC